MDSGTQPASAPVEKKKTGGFYGSAVLGIGGPFGANTTTAGNDSGAASNIGVLALAGYAFTPNIGLDGFFHYNTVSFVYEDPNDEPDEISGSMLFYGIEARGIVGDQVQGWASLGIAMGSASMELKDTENNVCCDEFGNMTDLSLTRTAEVKSKVMPVLGFGADVHLSDLISLGPHARWYITSVEEACTDQTVDVGGQSNTENDCSGKAAIEESYVPDIFFVGVGINFTPR